MKIEVGMKNFKILEALSAETRIRIIELINQKPRNIKELAENLGISSAIVTKHIQKLEDAGIIRSESVTGKRGMQKICSLNLEQATLQFKTVQEDTACYSCNIPVGQYHAFDVKPTCGLLSQEKIIGVIDDPRYFADPDHVNASMLWFGSGWVEYAIPNYMLASQSAKSLTITMEICSECPCYNLNWPSDISFSINGLELGYWTCPGDYGDKKGLYTPEWWSTGTQYGLLKTLLVNHEGAFIDGIRISNATVKDLDISYGKRILFRIACLENAANKGGVTLLGRNFGNYNQDISAIIRY